MREILFRGKRIENEEWVFGSLLIDGEAHKPIEKENLSFSKCYIAPETDRENIKTRFNDGSFYLNTIAYHIIPETIGQYTGLKDTKGKKIFEGDILQYWNRYQEKYEGTCVVKYGEFNCSCCDGVYGWYLEDGDIRYLEDETYLLYEVRGNIYDNPKLLKEGE